MKAQYVGDIGDFGKVLLLRHLAGSGLRIGVNWGLTPNDENADGKHRDYAGYRGRDCLCCCDEEVFKRILPTAQRNREDCELTHLEVLIRELCGTVTFFSEIFSSGHARSALDRRAFDLLNPAAAELVFFDPDNGIDLNAGSSAKHVYLSELKRYWSRGQSVLIYHHLSRTGSHERQIGNLELKLSDAFPNSFTLVYRLRRGTARAYFLCVQPKHRNHVQGREVIEPLAPLQLTKRDWARLAKSCIAHPNS